MHLPESSVRSVVDPRHFGGVDANGLHVVENKVDLCQLGAHRCSEVLFDAAEDSLGRRLLGEVVPGGDEKRKGQRKRERERERERERPGNCAWLLSGHLTR